MKLQTALNVLMAAVVSTQAATADVTKKPNSLVTRVADGLLPTSTDFHPVAPRLSSYNTVFPTWPHSTSIIGRASQDLASRAQSQEEEAETSTGVHSIVPSLSSVGTIFLSWPHPTSINGRESEDLAFRAQSQEEDDEASNGVHSIVPRLSSFGTIFPTWPHSTSIIGRGYPTLAPRAPSQNGEASIGRPTATVIPSSTTVSPPSSITPFPEGLVTRAIDPILEYTESRDPMEVFTETTKDWVLSWCGDNWPKVKCWAETETVFTHTPKPSETLLNGQYLLARAETAEDANKKRDEQTQRAIAVPSAGMHQTQPEETRTSEELVITAEPVGSPQPQVLPSMFVSEVAANPPDCYHKTIPCPLMWWTSTSMLPQWRRDSTLATVTVSAPAAEATATETSLVEVQAVVTEVATVTL